MEVTIDRIDKARASRIRMMRNGAPCNATEVFCLVSGAVFPHNEATKEFADLHACVWFVVDSLGEVADLRMCFDQERDISGEQPVHTPDMSDEVCAELIRLAALLEGRRCG